ncbi:molybdenum ABC transporter ATP-binding protein [Parahaliea maris]|uniref:Molybdenum ABC transporter ATP-binding protein n=1 Tax=Parahaliea maris TaxID=2716870 RepID=A0A5C8ZQI2_9GAMM|nr:molybdenum ABC transporter ATP-binding protein [Parahaliea maris]TXS90698.1 molybdenum ABC transporter ATP-binding protein [Parahaliea maris]
MSQLALRVRCRGADDFLLEVSENLPLLGVTAIYGASGSGKTTLLECIAGLRSAEPGSQIHFDTTPWQDNATQLPPWQRGIGYVFQDARLFPHLDVEGNLHYGLQRHRHSSGPSVAEVCHWLGLEPLLHRQCDTLSAGQRQRVAMGRALLAAPRLLLLDEPLANLDGDSRRQCLDALKRAICASQVPALYVSHDAEEVSQLADRLLILESGQVVQHGSLLALSSRIDCALSRDEQAAAILQCELAGHDEAFGLSELRAEGHSLWVNHMPGAPGEQHRLRIPARDVSLCREQPRQTSILNVLPVQVTEIETGDSPRALVRLAVGEQFLLARITRKSATTLQLKPGDHVFAQIKSTALLTEIADPA